MILYHLSWSSCRMIFRAIECFCLICNRIGDCTVARFHCKFNRFKYFMLAMCYSNQSFRVKRMAFRCLILQLRLLSYSLPTRVSYITAIVGCWCIASAGRFIVGTHFKCFPHRRTHTHTNRGQNGNSRGIK